ncbi:phosphate ABC transporter substrate-binding protein, PhoT family [Cognatiyoonia koreensis]|uniref:Phosphate ABC transporter substrate-binding protein, PhoT family n=1 Tax=Cognatiyoonia koreensis TaxID=364200 RepID=A0A1I0RLY3_9RHOB|nr:phosphate ABC transporter substrate-binding/OmpA family protein [Cognatiyoonia koreensis]SEW42180.1 phosphate ABC transporter substrate-binding protein, PhoT family [Cognatiyoonia koreensis]
MASSRANLKKRASIALVAFGAGILPMSVLADEVILKSADGTVNLVGEVIEFTNDNYIIRTGLGDLHVAASRVRCEGDACPKPETTSADVQVAGSDTVGLDMMPLLISGYASYLDAEASVFATGKEGEIHAKLVSDSGFGDKIGTYLVTSTSSDDAFKTLLNGSAQIGMATRRVLPAEARELRNAGAGNMTSPEQEHIIAVDSLVVIAHPDNPVNSLSIEQLAGIYAGEITNWSDVGGNDAPITIISRQEGSGIRSVFEDRVFGASGAKTAASAIEENDNSLTAASVNADVNAIGYVGYAFQRGAKALSLVNECGINMTPDEFSAKTEEYALQHRLYLYNRGDDLDAAADEFINYVMSDEADSVIAKSGFIDLSITRREQAMNGDRARMLLDPSVDAYEGSVMREMLSQMADHDRLSTTFRFRTGSSRLDERGAIDMARLADYLEAQPEGSKIMFVGFTDGVGEFDNNHALSIGRAEQVMNMMQQFAGDRLAGIEFTASGYGEVAPSACNTAEDGRAINRRVEVWIAAADQT